LISLGHICELIPKRVGKEIKEFISKNVVKEILSIPSTNQLNLSSSQTSINSDTSQNTSLLSNGSNRRKNNLKLAGKWCENEDDLPFSTRCRIESLKMIARWCLGLKQDQTNMPYILRMIIKILRENSTQQSNLLPPDSNSKKDETIAFEENKSNQVCEAEMSRLRCVCGAQMLKLAQDSSFRNLITPEFFHTVAKLMIVSKT
jgi:hypothetical protein